MHNEHHGPPDTSRGFEQSDLSISGIVKGVVWYFVFTGAVGAVVLGYMWSIGVAHNPQSNEMPARHVPPEPNPVLQNNFTARTDLWNLRARETMLLESASYANPQHTIARIPINDAIDMAAARGPQALATLPPIGPTPESNREIQKSPAFNQDAANPPNSIAGAHVLPPQQNPNKPFQRGGVFVPRGGNSTP